MSKQCKGQMKPTAKAWNANRQQTFFPYYHNDPNVNGNHKVISLNLILSSSHTHILTCYPLLLWGSCTNCCNQNKAQISQAIKSFPQLRCSFAYYLAQFLPLFYTKLRLQTYPSPQKIWRNRIKALPNEYLSRWKTPRP